MAKQVRELMDGSNKVKFMGTVEADETYVGGKGKETRGGGAKKKTPVFGIVRRNGDVRAFATSNVKSSTIRPIMRNSIEVGTNLMTDEY